MNSNQSASRRQFIRSTPLAVGAAFAAANLPQSVFAAQSDWAFELGEQLGLQARAILGRPAKASLLEFEFSDHAFAKSLKQGFLTAINLPGPQATQRSGGAIQWHGDIDPSIAAFGYAVVGVEGTDQTAVIELTHQALVLYATGASVQALQACGECRVLIA